MHRSTLTTVVCLLLVCGCGGGGGGSGGTTGGLPGAPSLVAGTAETMLTVPFGGVLAADVDLVTGAGLSMHVAAGTRLRTDRGANVQGPVRIGVDDGGASTSWPGVSALLGTARVYVLVGPMGMEAPLPVVFDPPARLEAPLQVPPAGGGYDVFSWMANGRFVVGAPPGMPFDPTGTTAVPLGMADLPEDGSVAGFDVRATGVLGATYVPLQPTSPKPGRQVVADTLHEVELPPDTNGMRVCVVKLINPDTAQVVLVMRLPGAGLDTGDAVVRSNPSGTWILTVAEHDGKRWFQVRTNFKNDLVIRVSVCGRDMPVETVSNAGSDDEADETGRYAGCIQIRIDGWGGFRQHLMADETMRMAFDGLGYLYVRYFFAASSGDRFFSEWDLCDYDMSVRTLLGLLPASWVKTAGNRRLQIRIPCPPPRVVTTTLSGVMPAGGGAINRLDATTLAGQGSIPLGSAVPLDLAIDPDGSLGYVCAPDVVQRVDLASGMVMNQPVMGASGALALTPTQEDLLVAAAGGQLLALDPDTLLVNWQIPIAPGPYTSCAVPFDGSTAYLYRNDGNLLPVDLLRRQALPPVAVPGAGGVAVSGDGSRLSVLDPVGGGIHLIPAGTLVVGPLIPTGLQPAASLFTPDDSLVLVANAGQGTVSVLDAATGMVVHTLNVGSNPNGLAVYGLDGNDAVGLVTNFGDDTVQRFPLTTMAVPEMPVAVPPQPNLARASGR